MTKFTKSTLMIKFNVCSIIHYFYLFLNYFGMIRKSNSWVKPAKGALLQCCPQP